MDVLKKLNGPLAPVSNVSGMEKSARSLSSYFTTISETANKGKMFVLTIIPSAMLQNILC